VKSALREVRLALLEADVNFRVVKDFVVGVEQEAVGQAVLESLTPAQAVIRIVRDHLVALLGGAAAPIQLSPNPPTVIYLVGLQGAGKTAAAAKLARWFHREGRHPLLVAADVTRPAAQDQLEILVRELGTPVVRDAGDPPTRLVALGLERSRKLARDVILVDTAGRLHVDHDMMAELEAMQRVLPAHETLLVVDAMTGQEAVGVAEAFHRTVRVDGLIMTKLDADARGGAALSIKQVTGIPIKMVGVSEKLDGLEPFHPDRMASRILGMGDVLSLIERAEQSIDAGEAEELAGRLGRQEFTLDEFLLSLRQLKKMGPLSQLIDMMGLGGQLKKAQGQVDDGALVRVEAILSSMSVKERRHPDIIDGSRRRRIARGSGSTVQDVNRVLRQFDQMKRLTRQFGRGKRLPKGFPPMGPGGPPRF
jgi:signal recognition particle subunit SRP54